MGNYGFREVIGKWDNNYLSDREHEVNLNEIISEKMKIKRDIIRMLAF